MFYASVGTKKINTEHHMKYHRLIENTTEYHTEYHIKYHCLTENTTEYHIILYRASYEVSPSQKIPHSITQSTTQNIT